MGDGKRRPYANKLGDEALVGATLAVAHFESSTASFLRARRRPTPSWLSLSASHLPLLQRRIQSYPVSMGSRDPQ